MNTETPPPFEFQTPPPGPIAPTNGRSRNKKRNAAKRAAPKQPTKRKVRAAVVHAPAAKAPVAMVDWATAFKLFSSISLEDADLLQSVMMLLNAAPKTSRTRVLALINKMFA